MPSVRPTGAGQYLGTPEYCSPEQVRGQEADGRADQYGLACVAWHLLTGSAPFTRDQGMAVLLAHLSEPPPALSCRRPDLPRAADAVLERALAKSPQDRYDSCREFTDALREALALPPYLSEGGASPAAAEPDHPHTVVRGTPGFSRWDADRTVSASAWIASEQTRGAQAGPANQRFRSGPGPRNDGAEWPGRGQRRRVPVIALACGICAAAIAVAVALAVPGMLRTGDVSPSVSSPQSSRAAVVPVSGSTSVSRVAPTAGGGSPSASSPQSWRAALPSQTAAAGGESAILSGTWTGTYYCSQGETGLRLIMRAGSDGQASATFDFYSVPSNQGVPSGSFAMTGSYSAAGVILTPAHWISQPPGYEMVGLDGHLTAGNQAMLAGNVTITSGCTSFSIRRAGGGSPSASSPQSSRAALPSHTAAAGGESAILSGTWTGTYTCSQGETGLRLIMRAGSDDQVSATFDFYPLPSNPGVPSGSFAMTGSYSAAGVILTPAHWISQPPGYEMVGLDGHLTAGNQAMLAGNVTITSGCTSFSIQKL